MNMIRYADDKAVVCNKRIWYEDQRKKDKSDVYFKQRKYQNEHLHVYRWSTN